MVEDNEQMMKLPAAEGFDVIIVSTSSPSQEAYWQERLDSLRGQGLKQDALIVCVTEDWEQGAGNGLGTLYAYQMARKKALETHRLDISERQQAGSSIALYHTAGQGKRLAPLSLSEGNNKTAVKLPGFWRHGSTRQLTVLEGVIKQTSLYAQRLKGRLAVFWGDQIFLPEKQSNDPPTRHVELLAIAHPFPTPEAWDKKQLDSYGILARDFAGSLKLLDKIDFHTLKNLVTAKSITQEKEIAISLGSFNLSADFLQALLDELAPELAEKREKMDTDPHFWMAITLDLENYLQLMSRRGVAVDSARDHYNRIRRFIKGFLSQDQLREQHPLFGILDIGSSSYWWDFGTVQAYMHNNLKLTEKSAEGEMLRQFYAIGPEHLTEEGSVIFDSAFKEAKITGSVVCSVKSDSVHAERSLLMHTEAKAINAAGAIAYNVVESGDLTLAKGMVRADLEFDGYHEVLSTTLARDGKEDWAIVIPPNAVSYQDFSALLES
jgi:hypothetical protein